MNRRVVLIIAAIVLIVAGCLSWRAWKKRETLNTSVSEGTTNDNPADARVAAEDWPKWRGPRGDGVSRETGLAEAWPPGGPRKLWDAKVGLGYASPIAAGGRVYVFTLDNRQEALTAFDANSGHILWHDKADAGWTDDYAGTRATPAIDGDAIYTYGGAGDLVCRDLGTGKPRWQANVLALADSKNLQWGVASSPLVANGLVYVQSGTGGAIVAAVRKDNGQVGWLSEAKGVGGYAHPILADVSGTPQLIVFAGDSVFGMDPMTGKTIWTVPWNTQYDVNASTPVYHDGHLFVTSAYGMGGMMIRVTPTGAQKVWSNKQVKSKFQQTILDGGALYANSEGTLKCLSWPDGAVKWKSPDDSEPRLGELGSIVRAGDKLITLSDGGVASLVRATPEGMKVLGEFEAVKGDKVWSTPLLYGGRLYVKGLKELRCFDLAAPAAPAGPSTQPSPGGA